MDGDVLIVSQDVRIAVGHILYGIILTNIHGQHINRRVVHAITNRYAISVFRE